MHYPLIYSLFVADGLSALFDREIALGNVTPIKM